MSETLINEQTRTANKQHTCSGCHHTIYPGTEYTIQTSIFDGRWYTWKSCDECIPIELNQEGEYQRLSDILDGSRIRDGDVYWKDARILGIQGVWIRPNTHTHTDNSNFTSTKQC